MTLYNQGSSLTGTRSTFAKGASLVIRAMLQSPTSCSGQSSARRAPRSTHPRWRRNCAVAAGTGPDEKALDLRPAPASWTPPRRGGAGHHDARGGHGHERDAAVPRRVASLRLLRRHLQGECSDARSSLNAEYLVSSYRFFDNIFTQGLGLNDVLLSTSGFTDPGWRRSMV